MTFVYISDAIRINSYTIILVPCLKGFIWFDFFSLMSTLKMHEKRKILWPQWSKNPLTRKISFHCQYYDYTFKRIIEIFSMHFCVFIVLSIFLTTTDDEALKTQIIISKLKRPHSDLCYLKIILFLYFRWKYNDFQMSKPQTRKKEDKNEKCT